MGRDGRQHDGAAATSMGARLGCCSRARRHGGGEKSGGARRWKCGRAWRRGSRRAATVCGTLALTAILYAAARMARQHAAFRVTSEHRDDERGAVVRCERNAGTTDAAAADVLVAIGYPDAHAGDGALRVYGRGGDGNAATRGAAASLPPPPSSSPSLHALLRAPPSQAGRAPRFGAACAWLDREQRHLAVGAPLADCRDDWRHREACGAVYVYRRVTDAVGRVWWRRVRRLQRPGRPRAYDLFGHRMQVGAAAAAAATSTHASDRRTASERDAASLRVYSRSWRTDIDDEAWTFRMALSR